MRNASDPLYLDNGVSMPRIGFGVYQIPDGPPVINAVREALATGYRLVDTASLYGNERGVGGAIRTSGLSRSEIFVTTKVWNTDQGYESTLRAFEASRRRLGLEQIDLYLIHWPNPERHRDTWRALEKLYQDGVVRAIGVSNFSPRDLEDLATVARMRPLINQIEWNPFHLQPETWSYCRSHGIQVEAWAPLARGRLSHPVLEDVAARHGRTPAQIVLRWAIQHGVIPIPKSARPERIRENFAVFDFTLDDEEMMRIDSIAGSTRQS